MSTLIGSFDGLHDNRVLCYCAEFEDHILHMDNQTESGAVSYTHLDVYKRQTSISSRLPQRRKLESHSFMKKN